MSEEKRVIPCMVFSRIVGYLQPVESWNLGKVQEFKDRVVYKVKEEVPQTERDQDASI